MRCKNKIFSAVLITCYLLSIQYLNAQSTSLIDAVRSSNLQEVKAFIQTGANVNAYDDDSDNVLINAAIYASADCIKLLLQHKANPNLKNKYGQTPLMLSAYNLDKIKLLVYYGPSINDTAKSGNSVLLIACSGYGMYKTVKWLIDNGANVNAKRWNAETALMHAAQFSDTNTLKLLLAKGLILMRIRGVVRL